MQMQVPTASIEISIPPKNYKSKFSFFSFIKERNTVGDYKKLMHSIKVGIALVIVSLLFLLNPLYERAGDNAMWAVMTVIVIFEFHAGATLGKGLNRGLGTILGGGFGCFAAVLAEEAGRIGGAIIVASSVFSFGVVTTYARLMPRIKKRYDYGAMIFILTFSLVLVSGVRVGNVITLARDRLSAILAGFVICIFTSIVIFPVWASDELHGFTASKFEHLASSLEGCLEAYLMSLDKKEAQCIANISSCKLVLYSKSKDESLVNFAKWEPWHGKFGFFHPWEKYQSIGELLRELATTIILINSCVQSLEKSSLQDHLEDLYKAIVPSLAWTLRELGQSLTEMRKHRLVTIITPKLKSTRQELSVFISTIKLGTRETNEEVATASSYLLLTNAVEKLEGLVKEVDELGELTGLVM